MTTPGGSAHPSAPPTGLTSARRTRPPEVPSVYVLPTRFGGAFVLVALLTLVGCVNYLLSLGYALTFLLLSVWIVCAVHASRALTGVGLQLTPPERAFAGRPVPMTAALQLPASAEAEVGVRLGGALVWLLPSGGLASGSVSVPALPRGPQRLPTLRLEGHDPLALWRSSTYPDRSPAGELLPDTLLILPAPELSAPPPPVAAERGSPLEARRGAGDEELHSLREYRPGDSTRRIAWKQAARLGSLLTRVYDAPVATQLALDWHATLSAGDSEARLSRLCAWVLEAERRGVAFSLALPGARLELASGSAQVQRALELLARHDRPALPPRSRRHWPWTRMEAPVPSAGSVDSVDSAQPPGQSRSRA